MEMTYGTYCRVESLAGGCTCSNREFIKAAHTLLHPLSRARKRRYQRHEWLRDGLKKLEQARSMYVAVMGGFL